jgi:hypothetical protein
MALRLRSDWKEHGDDTKFSGNRNGIKFQAAGRLFSHKTDKLEVPISDRTLFELIALAAVPDKFLDELERYKELVNMECALGRFT